MLTKTITLDVTEVEEFAKKWKKREDGWQKGYFNEEKGMTVYKEQYPLEEKIVLTLTGNLKTLDLANIEDAIADNILLASVEIDFSKCQTIGLTDGDLQDFQLRLPKVDSKRDSIVNPYEAVRSVPIYIDDIQEFLTRQEEREESANEGESIINEKIILLDIRGNVESSDLIDLADFISDANIYKRYIMVDFLYCNTLIPETRLEKFKENLPDYKEASEELKKIRKKMLAKRNELQAANSSSQYEEEFIPDFDDEGMDFFLLKEELPPDTPSPWDFVFEKNASLTKTPEQEYSQIQKILQKMYGKETILKQEIEVNKVPSYLAKLKETDCALIELHITGKLTESWLRKIGNAVREKNGSDLRFILDFVMCEIKIVPSNIFQDCTILKAVIVPQKTDLYKNSFIGCTNLETVIYPESMEGSFYPFENCPSLKNVIYLGYRKYWRRFMHSERGCMHGRFHFPHSLKAVCMGDKVPEPRIDEVSVSAEKGAEYIRSLESTDLYGAKIEFSGSLSQENFKEIMEASNDSYIEELYLDFSKCDSKVKKIENELNDDNYSVISLILPDSIEKISCIFGFYLLKAVKLPSNLKEVEPQAFSGNPELEIITFSLEDFKAGKGLTINELKQKFPNYGGESNGHVDLFFRV